MNLALSLALVSLLATSIYLAIFFALHLLPTGYNPIRHAVSDYAVSTYGPLYRIALWSSSIGVLHLLLAWLWELDHRRWRAGISCPGIDRAHPHRKVATSAAIKGNRMFGPQGNAHDSQGSINTAKGFTGQYNDIFTVQIVTSYSDSYNWYRS